jgi:hypothetical protein
MKIHSRRTPKFLPTLFVELAFASWETIFRRSWMIARGDCSSAEYQRMVMEKIAAARKSGRALVKGADPAIVLTPWHSSATKNARRLRGRRS